MITANTTYIRAFSRIARTVWLSVAQGAEYLSTLVANMFVDGIGNARLRHATVVANGIFAIESAADLLPVIGAEGIEPLYADLQPKGSDVERGNWSQHKRRSRGLTRT